MNLFSRAGFAAAIFLGRCSLSHAQSSAPTTLPSCLIQYTGFPTTGYNESRLVLYSANQTFVEINSYFSNSEASGTSPSGSGTFSYAVDPHNPAHATITYDGDPQATDDLYFTSANSGTQIAPGTEAQGEAANFTYYPHQSTNGGVNFSNRNLLAANGTTYSGFVVQSGGPRWVLFRGVGATLAKFGVSPTVTLPTFTLYDNHQNVVGTSFVWSADPNLVSGLDTVFSMVGAFALDVGSDESVLLVALNPGPYTAVFKNAGAGTMLCEAYMLPY